MMDYEQGYDPATGMPYPVPPQERPPSVADAYRMGGLANMVPSETGSILEHTYPTPPEQVFGGYDKASARQEGADALPRIADPAVVDWSGGVSPEKQLAADQTLAGLFAPTSPTDAGLMLAGGPFGKAAAAMGMLFDADPAQAGKRIRLPAGALGRGAEAAETGVKNWKLGDLASPTVNVTPSAMSPEQLYKASDFTRRYAPYGGEVNAGLDAPTNKRIQTVSDPQRMMYPQIYSDPREIVAGASANYAPESPNLKRLFGVTRGDLRDIAMSRTAGDLEPRYITNPGARNNNYAAQAIMTPQNEQRLLDTLSLAQRDPNLRNTVGWYMMDPLYHHMESLVGKENAPKAYWDFINFKGMASPASNVENEIMRGTGAHWLYKQGRFQDFLDYGGVPETLSKTSKPGTQTREMMGDKFPADMLYLPGHAYHSTSQARPMQSFINRGNVYESESPKVTTYLSAHGVPEVGHQMTYPVQDSHIARSSGMSDVRTGTTQGSVGGEMSMGEYMTHLPWYREKIARPLGLFAGQTQPLQWSTFAKTTGVDSPIGAGKLELIADKIMNTAKRLNVSPEKARDMVLTGAAGAGTVMLAPKVGDLAAQDQYQQ